MRPQSSRVRSWCSHSCSSATGWPAVISTLTRSGSPICLCSHLRLTNTLSGVCTPGAREKSAAGSSSARMLLTVTVNRWDVSSAPRRPSRLSRGTADSLGTRMTMESLLWTPSILATEGLRSAWPSSTGGATGTNGGSRGRRRNPGMYSQIRHPGDGCGEYSDQSIGVFGSPSDVAHKVMPSIRGPVGSSRPTDARKLMAFSRGRSRSSRTNRLPTMASWTQISCPNALSCKLPRSESPTKSARSAPPCRRRLRATRRDWRAGGTRGCGGAIWKGS